MDQDSDLKRVTRSAPKTLCASSSTTVSLHEWWLVKSEGKGLAVGGLACRRTLGKRAFCSAAIAKRHDATTLETMDAITITLSGFINRSRTQLNGFPDEVCNHFLFGFPYHWMDYATQSCAEDSTHREIPTREFSLGGSENTVLPVSLDDLSVTRIRDLMLSSNALRDSIFHNVIRSFGDNGLGQSLDSTLVNMENTSPVENEICLQDETPDNFKKAKTGQKHTGDDGILDAAETVAEQFQTSGGQSKMDFNVSTKPIRGAATRNMCRWNNLEAEVSSSSSVKPKTGVRSSTIKASRNQSGGMVNQCALNESNSGQDKEGSDIFDKSVVRRSSSRVKNPIYSTLKGLV
ncbi:SANTA domain-containing protein [Cephalotus follicularis]|uniref:SANTA domain-containing protein n=1 Tax=Cephalotus follicularis TaxID=3775 RepID=A0A1Q3BMH0_CEPFO|nr:SANTA domain-containing protein [Cephalotus follicularis]